MFWAIPAIMSVMLILAICVCSRASQVKRKKSYEIVHANDIFAFITSARNAMPTSKGTEEEEADADASVRERVSTRRRQDMSTG